MADPPKANDLTDPPTDRPRIFQPVQKECRRRKIWAQVSLPKPKSREAGNDLLWNDLSQAFILPLIVDFLISVCPNSPSQDPSEKNMKNTMQHFQE